MANIFGVKHDIDNRTKALETTKRHPHCPNVMNFVAARLSAR